MLLGDRLLGVLDLDSYRFERYGKPEQTALEQIAQLLAQGCDWETL